jgi:hypothetical protein
MAYKRNGPSRQSIELCDTTSREDDHKNQHQQNTHGEMSPTTTRADGTTSYQQIDSEQAVSGVPNTDPVAARKTLLNFVLMSILFSANHGCVVGKDRTARSCGMFHLMDTLNLCTCHFP